MTIRTDAPTRIPHRFWPDETGRCRRMDAVGGGGRARRCDLPEHVWVHGCDPLCQHRDPVWGTRTWVAQP